MPVDWPFAAAMLQIGGKTGTNEIATADAHRQAVTAQSILEHLRDQPGMILADEVGMGKTYVALAVIASVLQATKDGDQPVIVMVPPGLLGKWRREWQRFKAKCTFAGAFDWMDGRDKIATTPTEFFKLLDDDPQNRARLIFLKTSCFAQGLADPWIKLAFVRYARSRTRMSDEERKRVHKWAGELTLQKGKGLAPDLIEYLLSTSPRAWKKRLVGEGVFDRSHDDPIPAHLDACKESLDYRELIDVLRNEIPGRSGSVSKQTLRDARHRFNKACQDLYWQWLEHVSWSASLLVLDEAHHARNDSTQLASLFRSDDLGALMEGREGAAHPDLWQKADRLLFLTATPFQLGHDELIRVLRSFAAANWTTPAAPTKTRAQFLAALERLRSRLNVNRVSGKRLDTLWGRLGADAATAELIDASAPTSSLLVEEVRKAIAHCKRTKLVAERDGEEPWNGLAQWVVRHNRPTLLPNRPSEATSILRRSQRSGAAILVGDEAPIHTADGLSIAGDSALPFLLAARAQADLAVSSGKARAFFAEGLSSSYEAFHYTREKREDALQERISDGDAPTLHEQPTQLAVPIEWYEEHISKLIPTAHDQCFEHPKIRAVTERAVDLWLRGEKVLVFAFYTKTVTAIRDHLDRLVHQRLGALVAQRLGLDSEEAASEALQRVRLRFGDADSPFQRTLDDLLGAELDRYPALASRRGEIQHALAAYIRTPSFIGRFMPLEDAAFREAIQYKESRPEVIQAGVDAFARAFRDHEDASGFTIHSRIARFLVFANELALDSAITHAKDDEVVSPLDEYLDAVLSARRDGDDGDITSRSTRSLDVVRAVFGATKREVRERVMLAFNSPLLPELLVSSPVLGEGVDLHRFCRHIIHHDLDWNPSNLEQRTGRLDRIHCKAEVARRPIVIYLPFIAGSADEKMFRVVRDRERWFQVVMGQKFELDERTTESLASRLLLPAEIASELLFDLTRWKGL